MLWSLSIQNLQKLQSKFLIKEFLNQKANNLFQKCLLPRKHGYPNDLRTQGLISGLFSCVHSFAAFLGPMAGGVCVQTMGYRMSVFLLIVMILAIVIIFCLNLGVFHLQFYPKFAYCLRVCCIPLFTSVLWEMRQIRRMLKKIQIHLYWLKWEIGFNFQTWSN